MRACLVAAVYALGIYRLATSFDGSEYAGLIETAVMAFVVPLSTVPLGLAALFFRRTRTLGLGLLLGALVFYPACLFGMSWISRLW